MTSCNVKSLHLRRDYQKILHWIQVNLPFLSVMIRPLRGHIWHLYYSITHPQLTGWHFCRHTYLWLSYDPTPVVHCRNCSPQDSRCHEPNSPERTCGIADHFCRVPHVRKCDIRARYGRVEFGFKWGAIIIKSRYYPKCPIPISPSVKTIGRSPILFFKGGAGRCAQKWRASPVARRGCQAPRWCLCSPPTLCSAR